MGVSYLVSLYNKADYIRATLDAIGDELAVTGGEIVVYDDASTDNSVEVAMTASCADRVRLIRGETNRGCVQAADALIAAATHEYTRFIDADDRIAQGSTEKLLAAMQAHRCDFLFGRVCPMGATDETGGGDVRIHARPVRRVVRNTGYTPSGMIVRTTALKAVLPLPKDFRHSQDLIISVRLGMQGNRVGEIALVTAFTPAQLGAGNLSSRMAEMFGEGARFLAQEAADERFPLADLRFTVDRYARRCSLYFRRTGNCRPGLREQIALHLLPYARLGLGREGCRASLGFVSRLFHRDRAFLVRG